MVNRAKNYLKGLFGIIPWREDVKLQQKGINNYLNTRKVRKLQFGCGPNRLEGWLNTDIYQGFDDAVYLDITMPFPLAASSIDYMIAEHLIEHIPYAEATGFLKECFDKLKPGGKIRITTPDLEKAIRLYDQRELPEEKEYIDHIVEQFLPGVMNNKEVFVINNAFRNWGHQFLYNKSTLTALLEDIGFVNVTEKAPGQTDEVDFENIDLRHQSKWQKINLFEVIVFEASKPS